MILVTGPTGNVGSFLLPELVAQGAPVRGLAHTDASRATIERQGADAVPGDLDDPGSLEVAMRGCDHLFLLSPPALEQADRERRVIDLAADAGVQHVVALSLSGADSAAGSDLVRRHGDIDEHLMASGLGYTILRPAGFMQIHLLPVDMVAGMGAWYGMSGDGAAGFIDARDIAAVAAHVLTTPGHGGRIYELTGPEAISLPEAAAQLSEAIGREVPYVDVAPDQFRGSLIQGGVPEWLADSLVVHYRQIREGHAATVTNEVEKATGRPARTYREFLEDHAVAFAAG